ncbi:unnamed protein product [Echinostoma caproni]|uniref:Integrase catalytic domain-containing protein n=1 Tax=Echinostoma caproni TaxID=27848 RepID=A0A183BEL3_9TREM|nr:unnamed protein product [Echinostoma caproni]
MDPVVSSIRVMAKNACGFLWSVLQEILRIGVRRFLFPLARSMLYTTPSSEFTISELRKTFSKEGVPHAIVADNGSHFTAKKVTDWLNSASCRHVLTPPRHPQSNNAAENFVRTLKSAISSSNPSTFDELDRGVDNFLMQYRNAAHSTTGHSPVNCLESSTSNKSSTLGVCGSRVSSW